MSNIIDAKKLSQSYKENILKLVKKRNDNNMIEVTMAIIQVGDDGGSTYYRNSIGKVGESLGIKVLDKIFDKNIKEEELIKEIDIINNDDKIHGILLLMPLPKHIDSYRVSNTIKSSKDIDGVTLINSGKLYKDLECFNPCTPLAIKAILKSINMDIEGKEAVILGRSEVVGKPLLHMLLKENLTVTICHSKTRNLKNVAKRADILISAIGKPKFLTKDFVKNGAIVIDVGTTIVDGKLTGDVDFNEVKEITSFITKVPGGVGSVTTTMLLSNLVKACENND